MSFFHLDHFNQIFQHIAVSVEALDGALTVAFYVVLKNSPMLR